MPVDNSGKQAAGTAARAPYAVIFVGVEEPLEALIVELIPDADTFSFAVPALLVAEIDTVAADLLKYLDDNYHKESKWNSIVLVSMAAAGFILKGTMNLASSQKRYQEWALLVSDLVFIDTPHRITTGSTWSTMLKTMLSSGSQPLSDKNVEQVEMISESFLPTAKKHRVVNILAPSSRPVIDNFDCRILDYWLESNIVLRDNLEVPDIADRIDDLDRIRQILAQPHMTQPERRFPVQDYTDFLSDLAWSWRTAEDHSYRQHEQFIAHDHFSLSQLDSPSHCFQLVGPAGYGKKTMLRRLAFIQSRSLQTTTVLLVKEDFRSPQVTKLEVLKSLIYQIIWQRPVVFPALKLYLDTFTKAERWTESSLWIVLRFLCQATSIGTLKLYIGDVSDWMLPLRPVL